MEALGQDLRHAFRQLVRRPGFTAVAVLSLALGIGGNAVIFAFFDGFVLHPFAYPEPDRVVTFGSTFPRMSSDERFIEAISPLGIPRHQVGARHRLDRGFRPGQPQHLGRRSTGTRRHGSRHYRSVRPVRSSPGPRARLHQRGAGGRHRRRGAISFRLWQGRFGGDPNIVGSSVKVNGAPTTVVGRDATGTAARRRDLWLPWRVDSTRCPRNRRQLTLIRQTRARRVARAGQHGAGHHRGPDHDSSRRRVRGVPGLAAHCHAVDRGADARRTSGRMAADWCGRTGAAHRVRESVEPAACPILDPATRDGRTAGARRRSLADCPSPAGGGGVVGDCRARRRPAAGLGGPSGPGQRGSHATEYVGRDRRDQRQGAGLGGDVREWLGRAGRAVASVSVHSHQSPGCVEERRPRRDGRPPRRCGFATR